MDSERYEINSLIGKGRTGGVYTAEDTQLKRTVAVRRFFSAEGDTSSADWEDDFLAIAQNLSNLQDPNLLTVLDAGVDEDGAFLVAQLSEGKRLSEVVLKTPFEEHEAHEMASQLLDALAHSHAAGFIHGALTAGSIMLTERARGGYRYIIMDMGLSRLAPLIQGADSSYAMMADPALLAPELFDGEPATEISDFYMLGHLIYLSLIGGHPFAHKPIDTVRELHKSGALPPITNYRDDVTPVFIDWIKTLTNPDVAQRPQSVAEAMKTLPKLAPQKRAVRAKTIAKNRASAAPVLLKKSAPPAAKTPPVKAPVSMSQRPEAKFPAPASPTSATQKKPKPAAKLSSPSPETSQVPVEGTSFVNTLSTPEPKESKSKKKLILASSLVLLLVVVVCVALMATGSKETVASDPQEPNLKSVKSQPQFSADRVTMTTLYSNPVEEDHSTKHCTLFGQSKNLDWVVFKMPISKLQESSLPKGNLIRNLSLIGGASVEKKSVGNLVFSRTGKITIQPNLFAQSSREGDGWKIDIFNETDKPSLKFTLHFTTWNCDAKLRILAADGATEVVPAHIYQSDSENTSFGTSCTLTEEQLKAHDSFTLELTTTKAKSNKSTGLSLNALTVE